MKTLLNKYKEMNLQAKASLWFLFANVFQKAVMMIFTPVFTRVMTAEEFSKYAVFQSWEAIFTVFATLNISSYATAKALVDIKDDKDEFVFSAEILTGILTCIMFALYLVIHFVFNGLNDLPLPIMISLFCDIFFVAIFNFWSQMERYYLRYRALVIISIFTGAFSPIIAFVLISYSDYLGLYKGWARIASVVFLNGLLAIYLLLLNIKKGHAKVNRYYWKYCIDYCIPLIPHFLAAAFLQKASQLFVDHYSGGIASGIFSLANSLALMMMIFNDALTKTLVPWTYKKLAEKKYKDINKPIILSLVVIGILDLLMCLVAPEIVNIFADASYKDAIYAIPPLVGVCFLGFLYNAYTNIEYYYQETKYVSTASIVAGISIVILEVIFVPKLGYMAAAYSTLISYCIYAFMHYVFMCKTVSKHIPGEYIYDNKTILKLTILFIVFLIIMPVLYKNIYIRYGIIAICMLLVVCNIKKVKVILGDFFEKKGSM